MRATCLLIGATALCACLDFDQFQTEPTTASSSSAGGGGSGGASTSTSSSSTTTTSTGMGGMGGDGGAGGSVPGPPPCGGLTDDFDPPMADLTWDLGPSGATFANGRAVASPPNGAFRFLGNPTLVLQDCSITVDVVVDTNESWFFGWQNFQDGNNIYWFTTNPLDQGRVIINNGGLMGFDVAPNVTQTRVRMSHADSTYRVELAPLGTEAWSTVHTIPAAMAPAWLTTPGYPQFGVQGSGSGTDAEFDNFSLP